MHVWCLLENGETFNRSIRESDFEHYERQGYKKNPIHLPGSLEKYAKATANALKIDKRFAEKKQEKLDAAGDTETANKLQDEIAGLDKAIEDKENGKVSEAEIGRIGTFFDGIVEVENFLLNLKSEKSKKRVLAFLKEYKFTNIDNKAGLKEIKSYARKCFKDGK